MKRAYYSTTISEFLAASDDAIIGRLTQNSTHSVERPQVDAWLGQIRALRPILAKRTGSLYFEFNIPRMGRRIDVLLILSGLVFMSTSYGKWEQEPAHYVLFTIAAILFTVSVVNIVLLFARPKSLGYFKWNAVGQLFPTFILAGLLPPFGLPIFLLNIAILRTLRTRQERADRKAAKAAKKAEKAAAKAAAVAERARAKASAKGAKQAGAPGKPG